MKKLSNKKLLHVALCGILSGTLIGCNSGGSKNIPITDRAWQGVACNSESKMDLLTGLDTAEPVDGLVVFSQGGQIGPRAMVVGGEPCSKALDVEFCESLLSEPSKRSSTLIVTSGDDVQVLEDSESILGFLGELDTQQKVFLWMHLNNMGLGCELTESAVAPADDGQLWFGLYTENPSICAPFTEDRVEVTIGLDGSIKETSRVEIYRDNNLCVGRIPPGKLSIAEGDACTDNTELGKMFARNAAYEAASVVAFTHLKEELEHHGAPQVILDKIEEAANDEVRHAKQVGDLAQKYGCEMDKFTVDSGPMRDLETIAMDNLVVGCIGETWGALVGLYQADNAQDSEVRETMKQVAIDEVGHAALSWEIQEWLYSQLSDDIKGMLDSKKAEALASLKTKVSRSSRTELELVAGLPSPNVSQALIEQLNEVMNAPHVELAS